MTERIKLDRSDASFGVKLFEHFRQLTYDLAKNPEIAKQWSFLRYYQKIIRDYFSSIETQSRGLLINLPPGMGKTLIAVAVAMDHMEDNFPIILASKSLHINFITGIKKYIKMRAEVDPNFAIGKIPEEDQDKWIAKNFGFVSMNASNMMDQMVKEAEGQVGKEFRKVQSKIEKKRVKEGQYKAAAAMGSLYGKFLIVDEAHNLFRSITNGSKNGIDLYNMIMHSHELKIIFLTGTIPVNDPFEYVPCFNMLAGTDPSHPLFPESYGDFRRAFVSEKRLIKNENDSVAGSKLTMINKDKFQNRIYGLVSHVGYNTMLGKGIIDMSSRQGEEIDFSKIGLTGEQQPVNFPKVLPLIVKYLPMTTQQYSMYMIAKNKEAEEHKVKRFRKGSAPIMQKPKSVSASTYKQKSRQMGNFAPPSSLGLVKFSEVDMDKIPDDEVSSVKLEELYKYLKTVPGIGYVYSQFVGAGGLGSIMRFLEKKGWSLFSGQKKLQTGLAAKKTQGKITTAISSDFEEAIMDSEKKGGNSSRLDEFLCFMEQFGERKGGSEVRTINVYVMVNGQTDLCAEGRQIGASNTSLNETGIKQAKILSDLISSGKVLNISDMDEIIVASSQRTHDVFNIIQENNPKLNMDDVIMSDKLSPRNGGILDGVKRDVVKLILEEAGRYPDEGLVGFEDIENVLDNIAAQTEEIQLIRDSQQNKEENEEVFKSRVSDEINKILERAASKTAKKPDYNIIIMAPNNVYTTIMKILDPDGCFEEIQPTIIEKIQFEVIDGKPTYVKEKNGGDDQTDRKKIIDILDKIIADIAEDAILGGEENNNKINKNNNKINNNENNNNNKINNKINKNNNKGHVFAYYSGEVDVEDRETIRKVFNDIKNADGSQIKLLLISSTGAEGLDLENARFGLSYEPYWVWSRNKQVFARGVRHNSHIHLPEKDQNFQPVLFIAVSPNTSTVDYNAYTERMIAGMPQPGDEALLTTDLELYIESLITENINKQFSDATGEVSIECVLNGEHSCRMCAPNDSKLFGKDFDADMRRPNTCEKYEEDLFEVSEIKVDGVSYYYVKDPESIFGYKLFEYDSALGNYREMEKSNELYSQITDILDEQTR